MMKRVQLFPITGILFILLLVLLGCSKNQDRYENPPWLGGSNIETLQLRGNYTILLALMDKAGYTIPISKQLFTLFAPNDDAFKAYFQTKGISSVDALTKNQAAELFTLHMLPNPRSRYQLIYEYQYGEEQGPDGEYAALFFRRQTSSKAQPYNETVRYFPTYKGQNLLIGSSTKLVPLFSKDYFEDFGGDPNGSDYTFLYPESKWEPGHGDMNWGNAMITESEVRTATGFIYFVDQVVPVQKNLDQYLVENKDKYSLFYDIMQRFASYTTGAKDDQNRQLYTKSYTQVANIAMENGYKNSAPDNMLNMFTLFLPANDILQKYLDQRLFTTYTSLDSVPKITLYYILQSHISNSLALISKISKNYFNAFGEQTVINKDDIIAQNMCSNGEVYVMKKILEPNVFKCVPGNLFFDANYSTFLFALDQTALLKSLAFLDARVTLFAPNNAQMKAYKIRYNATDNVMEYGGSADKVWRKMDATNVTLQKELLAFVSDHIYNGDFPDISGEGFVKMSSGNYIHYKNGLFQGPLNQWLREDVKIDKTIPNDKNGTLYNISTPIKSNLTMGLWLTRDKSVSKFKDLIVSNQILNVKQKDPISRDSLMVLKFLEGANYWTGFIPTNAAMDAAQAAGLIPTDKQAQKDFIMNHFIRGDAVFDDGLKSGNFSTDYLLSTDPVTLVKTYSTLKITNTKYSLTVQDHSGKVITVDHSMANILVRQGVVHKINSVLKY